jgi:hypothetical protein
MLIGAAWLGFVLWSRQRGIRIRWLVWFLLILALVAALSGVQNFVALTEEYEEHAARNIIPVYAIQAAIPALFALLLLWRQVRASRLSMRRR